MPNNDSAYLIQSHELSLTCCPAHLFRRSLLPPSIESIPTIVHIKKKETAIGRNRNSVDVFLDSSRSPRMISRIHAYISQFNDSWKVRDNRSLNGVFVNDKKVLETELYDRDILIFGRSSNRAPSSSMSNEGTEFRYEFRNSHCYQVKQHANDQIIGDNDKNETCIYHPGQLNNLSRELLFEMSQHYHTTFFVEPSSSSRFKIARGNLAGQNLLVACKTLPINLTFLLDDSYNNRNSKIFEPHDSFTNPDIKYDGTIDTSDVYVELTRIDMPDYQLELGSKVQVEPESASPQLNVNKHVKIEEPDAMNPLDACSKTLEFELGQTVQIKMMKLNEVRKSTRALLHQHLPLDSSVFKTVSCPCCQEILIDFAILSCSHMICKECIPSLLLGNNRCPLCDSTKLNWLKLSTSNNMFIQLIPDSLPLHQQVALQREVRLAFDKFEAAQLDFDIFQMSKEQQRPFLSITNRWNKGQREKFKRNFLEFPSVFRSIIYQAVGITKLWINSASKLQIMCAFDNLSISIAEVLTKLKLRELNPIIMERAFRAKLHDMII